MVLLFKVHPVICMRSLIILANSFGNRGYFLLVKDFFSLLLIFQGNSYDKWVALAPLEIWNQELIVTYQCDNFNPQVDY